MLLNVYKVTIYTLKELPSTSISIMAVQNELFFLQNLFVHQIF